MIRTDFLLYVFLPFFCSSTLWAFDSQTAGTFYPKEKEKLQNAIDGYIADADFADTSLRKDAKIIGIISPHAGYQFSGKVAGYGYKLVSEHKDEFDTVIVLALSHYYPFSGMAVLNDTGYKTPLGELTIDNDITRDLLTLPFTVENNEYFKKEHSMEVQLPFIQRALGDVKVVCVVFGNCDYEMLKRAGEYLYEIKQKYPQKKILVVASTDLSHFFTYDTAKKTDALTIEKIREAKAKDFIKGYQDEKVDLCGIMPVTAFLSFVQKSGGDVSILKYLNSGDTYYDKSRVVGYVSAVATVSGKETGRNQVQDDMYSLDEEDRKKLLTIARSTMQSYVKDSKIPEFSISSEKLKEKRGAFVTLKKHGELRGCIGRIVADVPLWQAVREMAVEAAVHDPRFDPVTVSELKDISIEISVLSDFIKVRSLDEVVVGRDGLIIRKGFRSGLLLPQVPGEWGWDKKTYLEQLCHKAGLPSQAYKDSNAVIQRFTAFVFGEDK